MGIKIRAFTLAEVLITLAIIGIVAALTIPTLVQKYQDMQYKSAYKKAFSVASQAWNLALANNEMVALLTADDKIANFNAFKSKFKISKDCNNSNNSDCWASGESYFSVYPTSDALAFIDNSGVAWSLVDNTLTTKRYLVDINGSKLPNKYGQDRFTLGFVAGDSTNIPMKITPLQDCLSSTNCGASASSDVCPSVATHACYFTSWIIGVN